MIYVQTIGDSHMRQILGVDQKVPPFGSGVHCEWFLLKQICPLDRIVDENEPIGRGFRDIKRALMKCLFYTDRAGLLVNLVHSCFDI